jgi:hypothetical protein
MKKTQHFLGVMHTLCSRSLLLAISIGVSLAAFVGVANNAVAATPPDNCFNFSGTTILGYYDNEDNNISNPACTKNVDIPATISGQPVVTIDDSAFGSQEITAVTFPASLTTIGQYAFNNNELTSLIIPNTVTSIGSNAFSENLINNLSISNSITAIASNTFLENNITSLTIPDSVTSIGTSAFFDNNISELTIPSSVTSIGVGAFSINSIVSVTLPDSVTSLGLYVFSFQGSWTGIDVTAELDSGDPARVQAIYDEIWYAQVYTESPSNPNSLADQLMIEASGGTDDNDNGMLTDSFGGHLINPARAIISHQDYEGATLAATIVRTGASQTSYMAILNPSNNFGLYYRMGDSDTFSAPTISGYTTPADHILSLANPDNPYTFVYTNASGPADDDTDTTTPDADDATLADSGDAQILAFTLLAATGLCVTERLIHNARRNYTHPS